MPREGKVEAGLGERAELAHDVVHGARTRECVDELLGHGGRAGRGPVGHDGGTHRGHCVGVGARRLDDDSLDAPQVIRQDLAHRGARLITIGADAAQHVGRHEQVVEVAIGPRGADSETVA